VEAVKRSNEILLQRELAFSRIEDLFERAIELDESDVALFLEREEKDQDLRREVAGLVAAHHLAGRFLERPALEGSKLWADGDTDCSTDGETGRDTYLGRRLGAWRLKRRIGEGGMSSVYLGVREEGDFEQEVAIKLAYHGLGSRWLGARLAEERRFLSRLDDPGIARLLDGGATEEGIPYLVMELASGQPIDRYCSENELALNARIDLFLSVLDTVEFAHRALIVHRDLKPAHVLVDAQGKIKLLDFGIAKLLDPEPFRHQQADLTRRSGIAAFTPNYASLEQLRGEPITTATDVYSLGVVFYQALTGVLPRELASLNPADIRAAFAADPVAPSRLGLVCAPSDGREKLPRDLDAIAAKALAADPRERYRSAAAFAEDLRRLRRGYPVLARRATPLYRLQRAISRHRWAFALMLLALTTLTLFLLYARRQAITIEAERNRAVEQGQRAEAVVYFLSGILSSADPGIGGAELSLREALDRGTERLKQASTPPKERLVLLETLGSIYRSLGAPAQAKPLLEEGIRLAKESDEPLILAKLYFELATLEGMSNHHQQAQALHLAAFELRRDKLPGGDPAMLASRDALVRQLNWHYVSNEGLQLEKETLEIRRRTLGAQHSETLLNQARYAKNLNLLDRLAEGCPLTEATLKELDWKSPAPLLFPLLINLGDSRLLCGQPEEARQLFEKAIAVAQATTPWNPIWINVAQNELANAQLELGRFDQAAGDLESKLEDTRQRLGRDALMTQVLTYTLGEARAGQGRLREAKELFEQLIAAGEARGERGDSAAHFRLGLVLLDLRAFEAAKAEIEKAIRLRQELLPPGHSLLIEAEGMLGWVLIGLGEEDEGERRVDLAREALIAKLGPNHPRVHRLGRARPFPAGVL